MVALLNGTLVFLADLIRRMEFPFRIETLRVSTYSGGTPASTPRFGDDLPEGFADATSSSWTTSLTRDARLPRSPDGFGSVNPPASEPVSCWTRRSPSGGHSCGLRGFPGAERLHRRIRIGLQRTPPEPAVCRRAEAGAG